MVIFSLCTFLISWNVAMAPVNDVKLLATQFPSNIQKHILENKQTKNS